MKSTILDVRSKYTEVAKSLEKHANFFLNKVKLNIYNLKLKEASIVLIKKDKAF